LGRIEGSAVKEREKRTSAALPGCERLAGSTFGVSANARAHALERAVINEELVDGLGQQGGLEWLLSRAEF
jgi:hypothetical protein